MRRLLSAGGAPEAVFAFNDMTALGAMSVIRDAGLRIPDDIAVVGFDDIPIAALTAPGLTTMAMPKGELGRAAANTLSHLLGGEAVSVTRQVFDVELVVRHSSARRANGAG
jgi:LacI family transcriptional regulator